MRFRRSKIKEAKIIQKMAKKENLFPYPILFYATLASMGYLYVIENNKEIVGYICFLEIPLQAEAFILQICLANNYQSKGLGKNLLAKTYQTLKNKYKVTKLWAHTLKERSLNFFKKQRWIPILSMFNITLLQKNLNHPSPHNPNP